MREVAATDLVPGDVVLIGAGDQIAADARLIETHDFRVDNSVLTGESRPSYKFDEPVEDGAQFLWTELPNLVFAGTAAVSGEARGVVIATGMNTQLGHIAALTQAVREEPSPLQRELRGVTRFVAVLAFAIGAFFFTIGLATGKLTLAASLIFAIGIIVAFVPEGLLPTLSLSLAIGVQRMAAKNALVKKLSSVETLGAATVICTDKTGTLTTNEMMVQRLWLDGRVLTVTGSGYDPRGEIAGSAGPLAAGELSGPLLDLLCRCSVLCSNTSLAPPSGGQDRWRVKGDPSEGALMTLAAKTDCPIDEVQRRNPRLQIFPFESVRKRMATINATPEGSLACWVKGAPEGIIPLCTHVAASDGSSRPLTHQDRSALINAYNDFATHGLRILALAWKPVERADIGQNEAESGLTLIAVAGMIDPPRPEVPGAIKLCHEAGIRVVMITGDYGPTARAIAAQIGMRIDRRFHLITSEQLTRMTDMRLKGMLARGGEVVFARSSPEDKLRIVRLLRGMGEVVAVTGDGVNDAPALKQAHIGVAMGQRGTEVSREAASMVLTDDNFASIVAAIEEGRTIYRNIKRFITYIFASNIPEAVPFVLFILFGIPLPLTIMQILAVDLGADLLPALALGAEPPEPGIMSVPPRDPKTRLIDRPVLLRALYSGTFETMAAMGAFFFSYWLSGWSPGLPLQGEGLVYERATTMCWAGIIAAEAGNVFNMRTYRASLFKTDPFSNPLLWPGLASMVVVIGLVSYVPFMQYFFGTAALRPAEIAYLCAMPFFLIAADEARKWFVRRSTEQKG
jgi:magnesium-transporting ATPase (P-type)